MAFTSLKTDLRMNAEQEGEASWDVECNTCGNRWVAVTPLEFDWPLQCPRCLKNGGFTREYGGQPLTIFFGEKNN